MESPFQDNQLKTGWRPVFNRLPINKNMALKTILPLGVFHSPLITQPTCYNTTPNLCSKCKASINPNAERNRQSRRWKCNFCYAENQLLADVGNGQIEQYIIGKNGDNGVFFIIDLCLPQDQLNSIKETLVKTIKGMPKNIYVGLIAFNKNLFFFDFSQKSGLKFTTINGMEDYSQKNGVKLKSSLGLMNSQDPRFAAQTMLSKYYVPISNNQQLLIDAIQSLQSDSYHKVRQLRQKRATGSALEAAISTVSLTNINTRFITIIGGPCTVGPGKVVDLPIKKTIRVFMDIYQNNQNAEFVLSASKYYEKLQSILINTKNTLDIWAFGVDQFGLLQMKPMVNNTGGLLAMHQLFNHYIFQHSFAKFYEANEEGMFNFAIASQLKIRVSKQIKLNGIIGTCKSLKQKQLKNYSEMEIGQGGTSHWYTGGICQNNSFTIIFSHSQNNVTHNKERGMALQSIFTYKLSDNLVRTRISTTYFQYLPEPMFRQLIGGFDEEAAVVMLARIAVKKSEIQNPSEVKKWVDRHLLKFIVKFASFTPKQPSSFNLPPQMKYFPQYMYHLRRSGFINSFGCPPDQSVYIKNCLNRQSLSNCMTMIQPILMQYTPDSVEPTPVELDFKELKDDVILLLDTYFNVLLWYGQHTKSWKDDQIYEDPQYEHLRQLFTLPSQDASQLIYDRVPVSNYYETFKNDGKQRYLKSRVNPADVDQTMNNDGHCLSDDAPIRVFMEHLIKNSVNYID